jgi:bifunctional DNase/RNase
MALALVDYFDLRYDHRNKSPVLFLKDADRDKYLPVWIGELEANSIEFAVIGKPSPRPLTHDLLMTVLHSVGARISRVVIDRLESRTYYAHLFIDLQGREQEFDCRPSDAIALALREGARIFVDEHLMYSIKFVELNEADGSDGEEDSDEPFEVADESSFQEFLRSIKPSDFKEN